ncbi:MAG: GntR family transcriptional regulator, partial [Novosphingobium sp.]|nr:GntR family transcriptional regulator [Novosphingobium sp.]
MGERKARSYRQCSIAERHLSPALRVFPPEALAIAPLTGIRALIYSRLWRPIADGRMKTGTPIAESELGEVFKVSRTVSRAVLEYMAAAGCLTIS